jgi:hypothetical protein
MDASAGRRDLGITIELLNDAESLRRNDAIGRAALVQIDAAEGIVVRETNPTPSQRKRRNAKRTCL